jgi:hypothetical protein
MRCACYISRKRFTLTSYATPLEQVRLRRGFSRGPEDRKDGLHASSMSATTTRSKIPLTVLLLKVFSFFREMKMATWRFTLCLDSVRFTPHYCCTVLHRQGPTTVCEKSKAKPWKLPRMEFKTPAYEPETVAWAPVALDEETPP